MSRKLQLSDKALDDLEAVRLWYRQPGAGRVAKRRTQAIAAAIRRLRQHPCRYARADRRGTRQMLIEGHVVIYEVHPDTGRDTTAGDVLVLRVFGPGQSREVL
jgi:plasmid stabilization system protein ParE